MCVQELVQNHPPRKHVAGTGFPGAINVASGKKRSREEERVTPAPSSSSAVNSRQRTHSDVQKSPIHEDSEDISGGTAIPRYRMFYVQRPRASLHRIIKV